MGRRRRRWRSADDRIAAPLSMILFGALIPALCVFMLTVAPSALRSTIRAARGEGRPGVFVAVREECTAKGGCDWFGDYTSDDGLVHLTDALIDSGPERAGDQVPALDEGERDPAKVYPASGSHEWIYVVLLTVGAIAYLVCWSVYVVRRLRTWRAAD